jgi:enterochelin esterase-like enzyme
LSRTLLVTVACTAERGADYGPGPQGQRYVDWLAFDLLPEVRNAYAVAASAPVTVAGASMGGLISFIAAERHPNVFASAICMSPAFAYAGFNYPDTLRGRSWPGNAVPLWIDNGTVGLEEQLQPGVDAMGALLEELGQPHEIRIYRGARHFESDWGARMDEALGWVCATGR